MCVCVCVCVYVCGHDRKKQATTHLKAHARGAGRIRTFAARKIHEIDFAHFAVLFAVFRLNKVKVKGSEGVHMKVCKRANVRHRERERVCVCVCVRGRERERERELDRDRDRETERQRAYKHVRKLHYFYFKRSPLSE